MRSSCWSLTVRWATRTRSSRRSHPSWAASVCSPWESTARSTRRSCGRLAELGRGRCELVESEDRLDEVMEAIHRQIGTPLLTDLALEPEGFTIEPDSLVPERLPDLFAGGTSAGTGAVPGSACRPAGCAGLRAARGLPGAKRSKQTHATTRPSPRPGPGARSASWKTATSSRRKTSALCTPIVALSLRFGVLSRFTAYVAIDHAETANEGGKPHRITQPVESPQGWLSLGGVSASMLQHPSIASYRSPQQAAASSSRDVSIEAFELAPPPPEFRGARQIRAYKTVDATPRARSATPSLERSRPRRQG